MDSTTSPTVLVLGAREAEAGSIEAALAGRFECLLASDVDDAWRLMGEHFVQVVISAGPVEGASSQVLFFERFRAQWPETMLILISDSNAPVVGDEANLAQALNRPWSASQLRAAVSSACRVFRLVRENERMALEMRCLGPLRRPDRAGAAVAGFEAVFHTTESPMAAVVETARQFASFDVPVLLVGEQGTGKAEMAQAIQRSSLRSEKPFQSFDCTGLSDEAIGVGLFGLRKKENGGPGINRAGMVRKADHGTLYICGIEGLSPAMQLRVLRLARDGVYEQNGSSEARTCGARLIMGTACDLRAMVADGTFRSDLYYTLAVAELVLPPLRARRVDIPLLARAALDVATRLHNKAAHDISDAAMAFLTAYDWQGNLSELENEITRMLILAQERVLGPELISRRILQAAPVGDLDVEPAEIMACEGTLKERVEAIEARILRETLTRLKWNKSRSASELGLSRVGLRAKLDRYGIVPPVPEIEEA